MTPRHTQEQPMGPETWKLDRHIPIAVIFALLVQTGGAVWWMSALAGRVDTATEVNIRQDAEIKATESTISAQAVRVEGITATASAELRAVRESIADVKQTLAEQNQLLREILTNGKAKP